MPFEVRLQQLASLLIQKQLRICDAGLYALQERTAQADVQAVMQRLVKELPLYVWLVALPQLTSRICHPHQPTQDMTQHILTRLTASYPQQVRCQP